MVGEIKKRVDGLVNLLSHRGQAGESKVGSKAWEMTKLLSRSDIEEVFCSGGVGANIITCIPDDTIRSGFTILGDDEKENIKKQFESLDGEEKFTELFYWARAYGGAIMLVSAQDGKRLDQPLDIENIKSIEKLSVFEGGYGGPVRVAEKYDTSSPKAGEPKIYGIRNDLGEVLVHESRVIRMDGRPTPTKLRQALGGWCISELQPVHSALQSLLSVMMSGEQMLEEGIIGVLKMDGLDSLSMADDGERSIKRRLDLIDKSKGIETTIVIDSNEEYERHSVNLSGVKDIQQNNMLMFSGAAKTPATKIFGRSPQGENATGESDERQYDDLIQTIQRIKYRPLLRRLLFLISKSKETGFSGNLDDKELDVEFPNLRTPTMYDAARVVDHIGKTFKVLKEGNIVSGNKLREVLEELVPTLKVLGINKVKFLDDVITEKVEENGTEPTMSEV